MAFGARELINWVRGAGEAVTETRTLGERVGVTAEAMGKLQYAARLSHIDGEQLTNSLEKMNHKLGEVAITGEGPAADALKRFGLSARTLASMGTEKAFFTLVDVIGKIQNPMERAAVAMDLFGKGGQPIINMAAKGSDALKAMGVEALATGARFNSIDAEKVAEADTAMVRIGESIGGIGNQIAVQLAPFITAVADQMNTWMTSGTKAGDRMAQAIDWVTAAFGGVYDIVQMLQSAWHVMQAGFNEAIAGVLDGINIVVHAFDVLYEKVTGVKSALGESVDAMADGLRRARRSRDRQGVRARQVGPPDRPGVRGHPLGPTLPSGRSSRRTRRRHSRVPGRRWSIPRSRPPSSAGPSNSGARKPTRPS